MARPRKHVDVVEVFRLRLSGESWPAIAGKTCLGMGTVYRAYRRAIDALRPFQNPKPSNVATVRRDCASIPRDSLHAMNNSVLVKGGDRSHAELVESPTKLAEVGRRK